MEEVKHKRWLRIFIAVGLLLLAQVIWWAMVFVKDVRSTANLRALNLQLSTPDRGDEFEAEMRRIHSDSIRHQVMFLSESAFFVLLALLGHYVLYRALKAEERSREIQRNFIEVVTHESKTPLTALKLRLESVIAKSSDREVGLALDEVRRLSSIFEKALSLNRIERQAFRFEQVLLEDVVRSVAHRLEPLAKAHGVALSLELESEATVQGDPDALRMLVQTLVENAILYHEGEDKKVTVEVRSRLPKVALVVADNGPGIDPKDRPHVFERFYRAQSAKRNSVPGTGLGLYLAKTLVEAHQGTIRLMENGERGCRFEVDFPGASA